MRVAIDDQCAVTCARVQVHVVARDPAANNIEWFEKTEIDAEIKKQNKNHSNYQKNV